MKRYPKKSGDIFRNGHAVATLDACRHRAEVFVQAVARASKQRVDWHYSGGIANVLYLGNHTKVMRALVRSRYRLTSAMPRQIGECGSCSGATHRPGAILKTYDAGSHGLYRAGDQLPEGTIAVAM